MRVFRKTDPVVIDDVFDALDHGELAFDIGANCGQSVDRLIPHFDVTVAVEPEEHSFQVLADKHGGTKRVIPVNAACSNVNGTVSLEVHEGSIKSGQLVTGDAPLLGWGERIAMKEVPSVTADSLMREYGIPNLVKVDTEGHEVHVLQGASRVLKTRPYVIIEVHSGKNGRACRTILDEAGYQHLSAIRGAGIAEDSWAYRNHYWLVGR